VSVPSDVDLEEDLEDLIQSGESPQSGCSRASLMSFQLRCRFFEDVSRGTLVWDMWEGIPIRRQLGPYTLGGGLD